MASTSDTQAASRPVCPARMQTDIYGLRILFEASSHDVLELLRPILPPGTIETNSDDPIDRTYSITEERIADRSHARIDGEVMPGWDLNGTVDYFEFDLHRYVATNARTRLFVHAGTVGWGGKVILVPGKSFAGKTTLVQAMCAAGATLFSDEFALVDRDGLIHAFPRDLRPRTREGQSAPRIPADQLGTTVAAEPAKLGVMAEVSYRADRGWWVRKVSSGQAVLTLTKYSATAWVRPADALGAFTKLVNGAHTIRGYRGETEDAVERLFDWVSRP